MAKNSKCAVLVPVGHRIEPDCDKGLRVLEQRGYVVNRVFGHSAIDQARSLIATETLQAGFEELMWIDADVGFEPDDVDLLRSHELPFVCGIYPKKGDRSYAAVFSKSAKAVKFGEHGGLMEVERIGFGFNFTRREVYEAIGKDSELPVCNEIYDRPIVPYFLPMLVEDGVGHSYYGEDYAFCERARRAGLTIYADTTVRLWHIGSYRWGWEDPGRTIQRFNKYTFHLQPPPSQSKAPAAAKRSNAARRGKKTRRTKRR